MLRTTLFLPLLLACSVSVSAQSAAPRILLISKPQLWSAPQPDAEASPLAWPAGRRVEVGEKKRLGAGGIAENAWWRVETAQGAGWLPDAYLAPPPQQVNNGDLDALGTVPVDRDHGIPPEYVPTDLEPVEPLYDKNVKARLRRQAALALESMVAAARRDGVKLLVVSGYRAWSTQQSLYERRVRLSGLEQSTVAKPGHSEHQLGTAVDLTDGDEAHLLRASFGETPAGRWLRENAWKYGFAISFTEHNRARTGVAPEPWHYRYWGISLARAKHLEALGESVG